MAHGGSAGPLSEPDAAEFDRLVGYYETVIAAYLSSDAASRLEEAVARFVAPVNAALVESAEPERLIEAILWAAWTAVIASAQSATSDAQQRLVELVTKIRDQAPPPRSDGRPPCRVWGLQVYADLPVLGAQMREQWDVARSGSPRAQAWVNLNAFAARLTATGVDFSLYALWTLRDCLEQESTATPVEFEAVRHWFTICGPQLASRAAESYAPEHWAAASQVGPLCARQGITDGGFTPRRWEFWRGRLQAHAAGPHVAARAALAAFESAAP